MASSRLARLDWYSGRTVTPADLDDQVVANTHNDVHSRKSLGDTYLRKSPTTAWVVVVSGDPQMRLSNIDGFVDHLPVYSDALTFDFDPTQSNELHDGGGGALGDNDVSGAGQFRSVIIGVSYTEAEYDDAIDADSTPVKFRRDDGICIRVIGGIESSSPDPADPPIKSTTIPIAKIIRSFNDEAALQAGTVAIQPIHTHLLWRDKDVPQTVLQNRALAAKLGMALFINPEFEPDGTTKIANSDRFKPFLRIDADGSNDTVLLRDDAWIIFADGKIRRVSDVYTSGTDGGVAYAWQSATLPNVGAGTRYYVRAQLDAYDVLQLYALQGAEPSAGSAYTEDADTKPDPTGGSGGEVSTMADDVLMGRITESAGPSYAVVDYDNNPNFVQEGTVSGDYSSGQDTLGSITQTIALTRFCAHALQVILRPTTDYLGASHPTNRHPLGATVELDHTRHEEIRTRAVGSYATVNASALEVAGTNLYFQPEFQYVIFAKGVQV